MSRIYKGKRTPMLYQCGGKRSYFYPVPREQTAYCVHGFLYCLHGVRLEQPCEFCSPAQNREKQP